VKTVLALLFCVLVLGGSLLAWQDGRLPGVPALGQDPAEAALRRRARGLLEALQYKDYAQAASFAGGSPKAPEAAAQGLIKRAFGLAPERLNMRNARITRVTLDSERRRGRTYVRFTQEDLNREGRARERERAVEAVFYWRKEPESGDRAGVVLEPVSNAQARAPDVSRVAAGDEAHEAGQRRSDGRWLLLLDVSSR